MGIWKPREIPNVDYFELDKPDLEPVAAIGIEIWTMQDGILFDNILIASDENTAASLRDATWKPKLLVEKQNQTEEEQAANSDVLKGIQVINLNNLVADCLLKDFDKFAYEI